MYDIIKNVINSGRYDLAEMIRKIDTIWIQGDLTDTEKDDLVNLAREKADFGQSVEILKKLEEHDQRIAKLEAAATEPGEEYEEYVPGKWYYKGDKITFKGKRCTCIAPEGVVCTWSPEEYPAYWQVEE